MYWGGFNFNGTFPVVEIKETLNQHKYIDIMEQHQLPYAKENLPLEWILQQDKAFCHKTKKVKNFFPKKSVNVMDWPGHSPDLSPPVKLVGYHKSSNQKR